MTTILQYLERTTGEQSPFSVSCSLEMGRSSIDYYLMNITSLDDLFSDLDDLVGGVQYDNNGTAALSRNLPASHPFMPWYCSNVNSLRGVGGTYQQIINPYLPLQDGPQNWCLYNQYQLTAEFIPRGYPIYDDNAIVQTSSNWYKEDGTTESYVYANEYERFCDFTTQATDDNVALQLGQMSFNAVGLDANSRPFMGQPRIYLNNEILKINWYTVPLRIYTTQGSTGLGSYLRRWRGRVNQNQIDSVNLGTFYPGELLYLGSALRPFTPPFANNIIYNGTLSNFERYVNIEMKFLYTRRPLGAQPLNVPSNGNYIYAGHNLNPFFGTPAASCDTPGALANTFLYCSTVDTSCANSCPLWLSAPIPELLFSDPDSPDAI